MLVEILMGIQSFAAERTKFSLQSGASYQAD
jgi:hypothetical protein